MEITIEELIPVLRDVDKTRLEYELAARLTGENFNVFNILRLRTKEVRTHSAFIAELLDPKGVHGQGSLYLELFLKQLKCEETAFTADKADVKVEYSIAPVDLEKAQGGRIDLLLKDKKGRHIVIENKIYAEDQECQLLRYHLKYLGEPIYYLTLNGDLPSAGALGLTDPNADCEAIECEMEKLKVKCISYREDILGWLKACHKASVSLPVIRETIFQYKKLIQELTHQTTGDKVKDKAIAIITEHPELIDAVLVMGEAWQEVVKKVQSDCAKRMLSVRTVLKLNNEIRISRSYDVFDREDGLFIGFRAIKGSAGDCPAIEEANVYSELFKTLHPTARVSGSYWNIGLFNPNPFETTDGFENLEKSQIVSLYGDENAFNEFVDNILKQAEDITNKLFPDAERMRVESAQ